MEPSPRAGRSPGVVLCFKSMSREWISSGSWYCDVYRGDQDKTKNLAPSLCEPSFNLGRVCDAP